MSRSTRTFATLSLLALLAATQGASAQDDGLYDAPIDPNSAFVRVSRKQEGHPDNPNWAHEWPSSHYN